MRFDSEGRVEDGDEVQLSRRLAVLHFAGVVSLVVVVLLSVLWVSAEHNSLANRYSQQLVDGAVKAFRAEIETLVHDYSAWDEAHAAILSDDREWLFSNIGQSVTALDTLDLIVVHNPMTGAQVGWVADSPPEGQTDVLPPEFVETMLAALEPPESIHSVLTFMDGEIWAMSAAYVRPIGEDESGLPAQLPGQIHGRILSQAVLDEISASLVIEGGIRLVPARLPAQPSLALHDPNGAVLAHVAWDALQPGERILRQMAMPLGLALAAVAAIAVVGAGAAVRSARKLERALKQAREADRLKTEFLSNVTHELRTPMNGIMGVAQLFEMTELDDEQRELVGVLDASARAQMALIGDLLDFSHLETGNRELASAPFAPAPVLEELIAMARATLQDKPVALETDWAALEGLVVVSDARAFRQIMTNLIGNAVKFTARGRVGVRASVAESNGSAELTIDVSDTGVGIPDAERERIFERFYRVDGSLTRSTEGTGLGLAISRRLAWLMGGGIDVESKLGVGSTFRLKVTLPIAQHLTEPRRAA